MATRSHLGTAMLREQTAHGLSQRPVDEIASDLLITFFRDFPGETVSRRNAINEICQRVGAVGKSRTTTARAVAEGWHLLDRRGLICRDPEQSQGDWWFLTRAGHAALGDERGLQASLG